MPFEPLRRVDSPAHLIDAANIDTDMIYPARFLLVIDREGIGAYAFHDWREGSSDGNKFPAPSLLERSASILVAGENFGCGSSREHAVWTLADLGLRCIIAPSFGEIFFSNCFKNGVLPIAIEEPAQWRRVRDAAAAGESITVDLQEQRVELVSGDVLEFSIPAYRRNALLNGWDEIDMVLEEDGDAIRAFEAQRSASVPWLFTPLDATE